MKLIIPLVVNVALLFLWGKLYLWSRRRRGAARLVWRRRVGSLLFFLPLLLWVAGLVLPEAARPLLEAAGAVSKALDAALAWLTGQVEAELTGAWALAVKPLVYALVYGLAGVVLGWPLDRLRRPSEDEAQAKE